MTRIVGGKEINLDVSKLEFEERVDSSFFGYTILYFITPKELISDRYPEAEHATISVEFLTKNPRTSYPEIMISPTKDGEDYDWNYLYIDDPDVVRKLISIGLEHKEDNDGSDKQD